MVREERECFCPSCLRMYVCREHVVLEGLSVFVCDGCWKEVKAVIREVLVLPSGIGLVRGAIAKI
jgi:hypothetical protein